MKLMRIVGLILTICVFSSVAFSQNLSFERDRHKTILELIKNDVKKHYYDPTLKGIDIEAKFKTAAERISQATSIGQMNGIIAQFLIDFDDSHLFFVPPGKTNKTDYGFGMAMVGDKCFVTNVEPKSDAEKKGLQTGDELYAIDGYGPTRDNLWKMEYFYNVLRPRPVLKLDITKPDGKESTLEIEAKISLGKKIIGTSSGDWQEFWRNDENEYFRSIKQFYYDKTPGLFVWKLRSFNLEPTKVDDIIDKIKSKNASLILDLRGNGGGRVDMLLRLVGNVFSENTIVLNEKRRKKTDEKIAKGRGNGAFTGKIVVLVDSQSASASEIFARVMQIENRGTVIGDRTAGAVMESMSFPHEVGMDVVVFFATSITIADVIMKDGKSLERIGVTPDIKLLPSASDLAAGNDPVLAKAAENLGFKFTPAEAGKLIQVKE